MYASHASILSFGFRSNDSQYFLPDFWVIVFLDYTDFYPVRALPMKTRMWNFVPNICALNVPMNKWLRSRSMDATTESIPVQSFNFAEFDFCYSPIIPLTPNVDFHNPFSHCLVEVSFFQQFFRVTVNLLWLLFYMHAC